MLIAKDAIAIVVGVTNPFCGGLSTEQVEQIFLGNIIDWFEVGTNNSTIRLIKRPAFSGTHQIFQKAVVKGATFWTGANF